MAVHEDRGRALLVDLLNRVRDDVDLGDLLAPELDPVEIAARLSPLTRSKPPVTWVGVNGTRVDAVLSNDSDEWRVVFATDEGRRVEWLFVYRRPPFFGGISGGRAVVINGPSGAGKSTLLDTLQRTEPARPWLTFDEPEQVGTVRNEYLIWPEQTPSLQLGYLAAIGTLAGAGNLVAVAAAGRSQGDFKRWLQQTPTVWVGLYCNHDVLIARERTRSDRWGGLAQSSMLVHDGWDYDLTFDTSDSPDPTKLAADVLRAVTAKRPTQ